MRPVPGTVLGGRYVLTERIAIGGMGEVWKGRDDVLGRQVAAKILKEEYVGESNFLERFRAEARTMGSVSHPGIAGVYDYGEEDGSPYLVMEFVPGEALSTLMERDRPLGVDRTLNLVAQAALALHAAHQAGVVHRDIKPGNILVTPDGVAKLTDFGIARMVDQAPLTKTGQVMGTAQYLAPEQATGKPSIPASDLYALGIIAYEALAGHRPFQGDSQIAIAMAQVNEKHPPLPDTIPEPVIRLVDTLLQKKPEYRPADAAKLAEAATALRYGDVAAAEAAVPQMIPGWQPGAGASEATTRAFNQAEENRTQMMGTAGAAAAGAGVGAGAGAWAANQGANTPAYGIDSVNDDDRQVDEVQEGEKKSSTGKKVGITLGVILGVALLGGLVYFLLNPPGGDSEPQLTVTPTMSESTPSTVEIDPNVYIGQTQASATSALEAKGLEVDIETVNSDETAGTVDSVQPGDNGYVFNEGDTVTLEISEGPQQQEPAPPTQQEPEPSATEPPEEETPAPTEPPATDDGGGDDGGGETGIGNGGGQGNGPENGNGNGGRGNGGGNGSGRG